MSTPVEISPVHRSPVTPRRLWIAAGVVVVLVAMGFGTKVVEIGSAADARKQEFSPAAYGAAEFPKVKAEIERRAVDATTLAAALASDEASAVKQYGVPGSIGPEMSVKFTGVVGKGTMGVYFVDVEGLPAKASIRVQTGPAINGTELRDATGTISFGQFTNQIEYQNAASALNNEMKTQVLAKVDTSKLTGKTISVVGAFTLINPNGWLVTPVDLSVQ